MVFGHSKAGRIRGTMLLLSLALLVSLAGCTTQARRSPPLIGITSVYQPPARQGGSAFTKVNFAYVTAVAENGGIPLVLPTVADPNIIARYVAGLDGLVLVGGGDIPPAAYGQTPHETVKILPDQRYNFERRLIEQWLRSEKPLLGVCLGMQFTNVVAGGSMIQDIPSQIGTQINHRAPHSVRIEPDTILSKILDAERITVHSYHHQAVTDIPATFKVAARSADGIIEALERTDGPFGLFVQWHPEAGGHTNQRNAIYGALIRAAAKRN
ncbi:MAG: gamma-glutamyl-gamma-aminobutyrate hydrolase family protein [Phycisphaerales bacterium]|nr:MAG: gamma-glutamyl-gamma-aminobutyrate hydrolase family protein [Phycisphaerales bacterium]